jgi:hypothetical protein
LASPTLKRTPSQPGKLCSRFGVCRSQHCDKSPIHTASVRLRPGRTIGQGGTVCNAIGHSMAGTLPARTACSCSHPLHPESSPGCTLLRRLLEQHIGAQVGSQSIPPRLRRSGACLQGTQCTSRCHLCCSCLAHRTQARTFLQGMQSQPGRRRNRSWMHHQVSHDRFLLGRVVWYLSQHRSSARVCNPDSGSHRPAAGTCPPGTDHMLVPHCLRCGCRQRSSQALPIQHRTPSQLDKLCSRLAWCRSRHCDTTRPHMALVHLRPLHTIGQGGTACNAIGRSKVGTCPLHRYCTRAALVVS